MVNASPPMISLSAPQGLPQRSGDRNDPASVFSGSSYPQNDASLATPARRSHQSSTSLAGHLSDPLARSIPIPQRGLFSGLNSALPLVSSAASGALPVPLDAPIALSVLPSGHMDQSFGLSPGGRGQNGVGRRMRLGSLFLTMLIWNDDAVLNSPGHNSGLSFLDFNDTFPANSQVTAASSFISPTLSAQPSLLGTNSGPNPASGPESAFLTNPTRNRSHTTTGAHTYLLQHSLLLAIDNLQAQPFISLASSENPALLDNLMFNLPEASLRGIGARSRSQTFSGAASNIPELSMSANLIMLLQQAQNHQHPSSPGHRTHTPNHLNTTHAPHLRPHHDTFSGGSKGHQPILEDDFSFSLVVITTNFENPSLGPTSTLLLDNVPQFMDAAKLWHLIASSPGAVGNPLHGRGVICVRLSSTNTTKLALVECASIEVAMNLKANLNHLELAPGLILYVAFAKISDRPASHAQAQQSYRQPAQNNGNLTSNSASLKSSSGSLNAKTPARLANTKTRPQGSTEVDVASIQSDLLQVVSTLSMLESVDIERVKNLLKHTLAFPKENYKSDFGPLPDPIPMRQFDAPKLRELRKTFEATEKANSNSGKAGTPEKGESEPEIMTQAELESLCSAMLSELPELCYDHIGNTIVQKLFTLVESPSVKLMMVKELAPYLTQFSIHKNGTWAIQKIINLCHDDVEQMTLIAESLKPYTVKLFNDQFGNYVVQCCLKFGSPYNDFIFETMISNFLEIAYGRFGARCIRTILESASDNKPPSKSCVTNEQIFLVASMIVEFANELVINNNGSLLITWFLETFNGCKSLQHDYRYELLCDKFMPHLDHLCTHKLANLTIFNILNNRNDIVVRHRIMNEIFGPFNEYDSEEMSSRPPTVLLETILAENQEHNTGPLFIYKILSNPMLTNIGNELSNARYKQYIVGQVKRVLLEIQITNLQPYKKLVDEVGLATNRLSRSGLTARKGKRDRRSNKGQSPHTQQTMLQPHMQPNQTLPPMGYGMPQMQMQMQMDHRNTNMAQNGYMYPPGNYVQGGMYDGAMSNKDMQQFYQQPQRPQYGQQQMQDVNVMQQLEQLSLSSAAMGYTSNPDTPNMGQDTRFA